MDEKSVLLGYDALLGIWPMFSDNTVVLSSRNQMSKWCSVISHNGFLLLLLLLIQYSLLEECTNPTHVTLAGQIILYGGAKYLWVLIMELATLHCWHLRILRRHPEFCKIYAPLVYNMKNLAVISVPLWNTVWQYTYIYTDFLCGGKISQLFSIQMNTQSGIKL